MADLSESLKQKVGPLPVWGWGVGVLGGIFLIVRHSSGSKSGATSGSNAASAGQPIIGTPSSVTALDPQDAQALGQLSSELQSLQQNSYLGSNGNSGSSSGNTGDTTGSGTPQSPQQPTWWSQPPPWYTQGPTASPPILPGPPGSTPYPSSGNATAPPYVGNPKNTPPAPWGHSWLEANNPAWTAFIQGPAVEGARISPAWAALYVAQNHQLPSLSQWNEFLTANGVRTSSGQLLGSAGAPPNSAGQQEIRDAFGFGLGFSNT